METETLETQRLADLRREIGLNIAQNQKWYILQSTVFVFVGVLAIMLPNATAVGFELLVGALFLVSGIVKAFASVRSKTHWWSLLSSLAFVVFGGLLLFNPLAGTLALATFLAIFLAVEGIIELSLSFRLRPVRNWGWLMFSGLISLGLAILLFVGWPGLTIAALGIILGVNFLLYGFSLLAITLQSKFSD